MHKVTIVIPVYNAEAYVAECVESVLRQTYRDIEVVLVDDGSKDGSLGVCRGLAEKDERVKVLPQANAGPSVARNRGIEEASGEYLVFVDADDTIEETCVEEAVRAIEGVDVAYWGCRQRYVDGSEKVCVPKAEIARGRRDVEEVVLHLKVNEENYPYFGFTWNKIFRKEIIDRNGIRFEVGLSAYEDHVFTTDYMRHVGSIVVLDRALYNYRIQGGGLTMMRRSAETFERLHSLIEKGMSQYSCERLLKHERGEAASMLIYAAHAEGSLRGALRLLDAAREYVKGTEYEIGKRNGMLLRLPTLLAYAAFVMDDMYLKMVGMKR